MFRLCRSNLGWIDQPLARLQSGIAKWMIAAFYTVALLGNAMAADQGGVVRGLEPYQSGVLPTVAYSYSLNGQQLVLSFAQPIAILNGFQMDSIKVVTPLGHSLTNLLVDPDRTTATFDVVPPFRLASAVLFLTNIVLSSGAPVSGFTKAPVLNLSARSLADGKLWRVFLPPSGYYGFVPIGKGLSEQLDDVGYLGGVPDLTNPLNGSLVVRTASDLRSLSAGLMIRKSGAGQQPYFCVLFQPLDEKTSRWLAIQRFGNGTFTSQVLADLPAVGPDNEDGYRAFFKVIGNGPKCEVFIRTGGAIRSFPDLDIGEAATYDEVGLIACKSGDGSVGSATIDISPVFIQDQSPPELIFERNQSDSFRLAWKNDWRTYLPARFEQLSPYPVLRVIETVVGKPNQTSVVELPIVDASGLYTLRLMRR